MSATVEEIPHQKAALVKESAAGALLATLANLTRGADLKPQSAIRCMVITQTGAVWLGKSYSTAKEWGVAQKEAFALFHISHGKLIDLPDSEVAARVAAL